MPNFVKVASISDLKPGTAMTVVANGKEIALYNVAGKICATDNTCLHQGGPLGEGILEGEVVACPWYVWEYNLFAAREFGVATSSFWRLLLIAEVRWVRDDM